VNSDLVSMMTKILTTNHFTKIFNKLSKNQKLAVEKVASILVNDPLAGESKTADLAKIRVHKFRMINQLTLLAYKYFLEKECVELWFLGSHENFYRDLKNILKS